MFCSKHIRSLLLVAALISAPNLDRLTAAQTPDQQPGTRAQLRWGQRIGVSRYRLQLARDSNFRDIVLDRVVTGNETEVNDLPPGRYFWRIASLTTKLGEFSSAGVIEVKEAPRKTDPPSTGPDSSQAGSNSITAGGGWRVALGDVSRPITARLRSAERSDIVAANSEGVMFALDSTSGVALWRSRVFPQKPPAISTNTILVVPTRARLENVVVFSEAVAIKIDGSTGRELWRSTLPAAASSGAVITDPAGSRLILIDSSRQRLFVLNEVDGRLVSQINLPGRAIGAPLAINDQGKSSFAIVYDTGLLEIRDSNGASVRSVNVASPPTTAPLLVRGRQGALLILGTRDGLAAMTADDLRPLGRVAIKDDAPRGTLTAQDLDGDGIPEVIMSTERRHLIAVNATDGKIIWDVAADRYGEALAFADINRDHVLDVFVSGGQRFALALSGRDGSVIWKDNESQALATNHAGAFESRTLIAVPYGSGVLLVGEDSNRTGLRAIGFSPAEIRPTPR